MARKIRLSSSVRGLCVACFCAGFMLLNMWSGCTRPLEDKDIGETIESWNIRSLPPRIHNAAESLHILIWNDYFPPALFEAFEKIYGVRIEASYFESNEQMREYYLSDREKWDLLMPSDYTVHLLIRQNEVTQIDRNKLQWFDQISPVMFDLKCDPGLNYFVPVFHSSFGMSFNVKYLGGFPRKWDYLDAHRANPFFNGRLALPDQMRTSLGLALIRLGFSPNSRSEAEIEQAADYLISLVETCGARFVGDRIVQDGTWKDFLLLSTWSGTGAWLLSENLDYRFLIPEEDTIFAVDGFVIPRGSRNKETAYLFLNFLMTPEVLAKAAEFSYYAPTSLAAARRVNTFIKHGPSMLMPSGDDRISLEDVGDSEALYEKAWVRVKTAQAPSDLKTIPLSLIAY